MLFYSLCETPVISALLVSHCITNHHYIFLFFKQKTIYWLIVLCVIYLGGAQKGVLLLVSLGLPCA